jgi:TDG/mug DNA glycosylase family protein
MAGEGLEDILTEHLTVIFCGINPGIAAAAQGHHFAGRGNRFWRAIHLAGFTSEQVRPEHDRTILQYRCGLTTVVERSTARADQLSVSEFIASAKSFEKKIAHYAPRFVAFLGKAAYSALTSQREVSWGLQSKTFGGASVWILPNPSGRNRAFTLDKLVDAYRQLYLATDKTAVAPAK